MRRNKNAQFIRRSQNSPCIRLQLQFTDAAQSTHHFLVFLLSIHWHRTYSMCALCTRTEWLQNKTKPVCMLRHALRAESFFFLVFFCSKCSAAVLWRDNYFSFYIILSLEARSHKLKVFLKINKWSNRIHCFRCKNANNKKRESKRRKICCGGSFQSGDTWQ